MLNINIMKKIEANLNKIFESKIFLRSLKILGVILFIIVIFAAGVVTGFNKASFGNNWNKNYEENFGMEYQKGHLMDMTRIETDMFPNAHGTRKNN